MSGWNLPTGVSVSDLPGNSPSDLWWEDLIEEVCTSGLDGEQICRAMMSAMRKQIKRDEDIECFKICSDCYRKSRASEMRDKLEQMEKLLNRWRNM